MINANFRILILSVLILVVFVGMAGSCTWAKKDKKPGLKAGENAPDFVLPDQNGKEVSLKDYKGKNIVLIAFYPKDDSPICTKEMTEFKDAHDEFLKRGVAIVGISTNSQKSHQEFKNKHELPFPLLSDEKKEITKLYGVYNKIMGVSQRSYFLVDKEGALRYIFIEKQNFNRRGNEDLLKEVDKILAVKPEKK